MRSCDHPSRSQDCRCLAGGLRTCGESCETGCPKPGKKLVSRTSHGISLGTYSDVLVFGTRGKVTTIGTEAHTADIEVTTPHRVLCLVILKNADLLSRVHVEDLCGSVAASGDVLTVKAESNTADDAVMLQRMKHIDIENTLNLGVEHGMPISTSLLVLRRNGVNVDVCQVVAHRRRRTAGRSTHSGMIRSRLAYLRRLRIWHRSVDLGSGGPGAIGRAAHATTARTRRRCALRCLRSYAVRHGALGIRLVVKRTGLLLLLLRSNVRWWESSRSLRHLVLRSHLLLRWTMRMRSRLLLLRGSETALVVPLHDSAEDVIARGDGGRLLRRSAVLGRTSHRGWLTWTTFTSRSLLKLVTQHAQLFFVSGARQVRSIVNKETRPEAYFCFCVI